ncbi:ATP-grasp domain-containing protein [Virgibacillus necropolis]|uniref:ATP-grasp domain-containing protein n=1 Tax=Virgibacillus necropolis TaxID=163877 RepID=UPI00384AA9C9
MKYTGWLIYNKEDAEENSSYINWFIDEAELQDVELQLISREHITIGILDNKRTLLFKDQKIVLPDFAIVRTIDPLLSLHLENMKIRVFNSSSISQICNNKELTHHHVHNLDIPMVDTIFTKQNQFSRIKHFDYPFVAKESTGRGGNQVFLIKNEQDWQNCIPKINSKTIVLQSSDVIHGKDLRVFVVGTEIVGAVLRENKDDFRANYKLGGSAAWYKVNNEEVELINKIIDHFQFDMVGIDFLFSKDGKLLFNEIEDVVGSRTLSAVSDVNILQKYITHIRTQLS